MVDLFESSAEESVSSEVDSEVDSAEEERRKFQPWAEKYLGKAAYLNEIIQNDIMELEESLPAELIEKLGLL
jgi:hypothetical protein